MILYRSPFGISLQHHGNHRLSRLVLAVQDQAVTGCLGSAGLSAYHSNALRLLVGAVR